MAADALVPAAAADALVPADEEAEGAACPGD